MRRNRKFAVYTMIFIFLASVFILFCNGRYGGDGLENYLTAESIVLDGDLVIYDRPFEVKEMNYEIRGLKDSKGSHYSSYGIGAPILLVPFYAAGHILSKVIPQVPHGYITQFCVSLINPLVIALTALLLFIFLEELGFSQRVCLLTLLCHSFCTMSLIYIRSGFSEPIIGLLVLLSILFLYRYEKTNSAGYILFAGLFVGYALLVKKNSFLYVPLFLFYAIYKSLSLKTAKRFIMFWLASVTGPCICILIYLWYHSLTAGSVATAAGNVQQQGIAYGGNIIKALFYYLLSPGKGFFIYNIILVLGLFGAGGLLKRERKTATYLIVFICVNILFYAYHFKRGSLFSWGPRYFYPIIPILCIFLAGFIEGAKSRIKKSLLYIFALSGFLIQLPCLFINFTKYLLFAKEALGLQEYLINFIPELSPISGSWYLFISAIKKIFAGASLTFTYNPDPLFLEPIVKSLEGYDTFDIWFVNVVKISPKLLPAVTAAVLFLCVTAVISFIRIKNLIKE